MNTQLTTTIEQFGLVDGAWQNAPHNQTAVREPKDASSPKGNLFVLVEVQGQISNLNVVEKRLVALIRDTYYPATGGVTAGLRRALQTANQWLYQYNTTTPDKTLVGGAVAVVLRENDLFVAQVGPTALFTRLNSFACRYPETSAWLDSDISPEDDYSSALGVYHFVEPNITHLQIEPDDTLLLTDSRLARGLSVQQVSQIISDHKSGNIGKNLVKSAQAHYGSGLIIHIASPQNGNQPPANLKEKILNPVEETTPPSPAGAGEKLNFSLPALIQKQTVFSARRKKDEPFTADDQDYDDQNYYQPNNDYPETSKNVPHRSFSLTGIWQAIAAVIMGTVAFLGKGLHTILRLVLPGSHTEQTTVRQAGVQARPKTQKQPSYRALKYVAIGLPLVVLAITLLMYWYRGYNRENEYTAALNLAEQKYHQAQVAAPDTARTLLNEAKQHLNEAATIKTEQEEVAALDNIVQEELDNVNEVQRLYYVPELRRYTDPGAQLYRVIVEGAHVYVLDTGLNRVFHHTLDDIGDTLLPDEGSPILAQQGEEIDASPVGRFIDMVWMPAGGGRQTSDLLALEFDGLLEFDPNWGATAISIHGFDQWQRPVAIGSYFGNFYVLDAGANQIYRYLPTANGYENPPEGYFSPEVEVDLNGAIDMAIDGAIYVLYGDGQIRKFLSGQPAVFQITGLDTPLNTPIAIYTAPDELVQHLYIADAGNQRIVQFTKEGQFVRQYKPRGSDNLAFDDLRSIFVDEISEKMYVLNGASLYAPNIPAQ